MHEDEPGFPGPESTLENEALRHLQVSGADADA